MSRKFEKKSKQKDSVSTETKIDKRKTMPHLFKPGQVANPAGRPKGSRNKLGEAFLADFLADWEMGGAYAIQRCRLEEPSRYVAIAASILPKDLTASDEERVLEKFLEQFKSVEDVRAFRRDLASLIAGQANGESGDTTKSRGKSNGVQQVLLPSKR